jgi:stage III sporulation protein AG
MVGDKMHIKEKIKELIEKATNKQFINNLAIILIIGIMILITTSIFIDNRKVKETDDSGIDIAEKNNKAINYFSDDYATFLEQKLERILSQIKGVGKVKVMITLEDTTEKIPAINSTTNSEKTNEKDSQGGTRETIREDSSEQVVIKGNDGSAIIIKEIKPKIKGAIVVAEGAEDAQVKEKLYQAVKTVLDLSGNKVEIYSSK